MTLETTSPQAQRITKRCSAEPPQLNCWISVLSSMSAFRTSKHLPLWVATMFTILLATAPGGTRGASCIDCFRAPDAGWPSHIKSSITGRPAHGTDVADVGLNVGVDFAVEEADDQRVRRAVGERRR